MWSFALYYVSPLQLLLLFLGRIETERPSDWIMRKLADALGMTVNVQAQPPLVTSQWSLYDCLPVVCFVWYDESGVREA